MKTFKTLFILISVLIITGCDKEENGDTGIFEVEMYIKLLKSDQYNSSNLPAFKPKDIPYLLIYRNETQVIRNFPRNPISSYYGPDCSLGMYVLWTIESIRAVSINSELLVSRFPSQNPVLAKRNSGELNLENNHKSHEVAAKAYYDWWNLNADYNKIKNIDPLDNTNYRWH